MNVSKKFEEELEQTQLRVKEEMAHLHKVQKAKLYWNIIFFIGALISSVVIGLVSFGKQINIIQFLEQGNLLIKIIIVLSISFASGTFYSFLKFTSREKKDSVKFRELIKDTYLTKLDESNINPQTSIS